ncbi:MAG: DUF2333 family protein [Pseudomonadales bacterium]|nr:DUF2333 family protein [Pseudomonadales bacterium]
MNWKFWQRKDDTIGPDPTEAHPLGEGFDSKPRRGKNFTSNKPFRIFFIIAAIYLVGAICIGIWWSQEPDRFDVARNAEDMAAERNETVVTGYTTTATTINVAKTLLDKPGGYLTNDLFPPGVWLDNIPSWEMGALTMLRDTVRVYRNDFSRSQSQSAEDPNLAEAEGKFFFNNNSWFLPDTEGEYRAGIEYIETYLGQLADRSDNQAQFYARSDNLQSWLAAMETRLGSLSQRLSASVGKRQLDTSLAGDADATQSTATPSEQLVQTPWLEVDNVFYEARGFTWALLHLLEAVETDFGDVLDKKAARVSLRQIIRELEPTQETLWSPMVLNGDGFGMVANHSLIMASHISRANAAIIDLRTLLAQG